MPTKRNQDLLDLRHPSDKKASKPLMEKRRRARINHSLAQLKALVIDPNTTERSRQTKLEKADILELTVRHLYEIKRQQRTALLVENRHPKKKFEIGYSECVREVELFLSNLINPQNSGIDMELQKRLKDHLNKRLQDFKSIELLDANSKKESSDEEQNNDELSSSPSSSVSNGIEDLPLSMDNEETDSADSSALNRMLKYYADDEMASMKRKDNISSSIENTSFKRFKKDNGTLSEEKSISFSCPSVTSTTECKSLDLSRVEKHFETRDANLKSKMISAKECYAYTEKLESVVAPLTICSKPQNTILERGPALPSCSQQCREKTADYKCSGTSSDFSAKIENSEPFSSRHQQGVEQIPLVPRQLANGDWALVLPASLVPSEKRDSYPLSAFRLVVPTNSASGEPDADQVRQRFQSSTSPLSSTVSDLSAEEFFARSDDDPSERMEHNSPDSTQVVWRPW